MARRSSVPARGVNAVSAGARGIVLARGSAVPLHRQLYDHIRTAIAVGQLRPGDRLPSARNLAAQFGIARGTVDVAYATLAGEGYIVTRGPAGTIVSTGLGGAAMAGAAQRPRPPRSKEQQTAGGLRPFQMGVPALDAFPRKLWAHVVARQARALSPADMAYPEAAGYLPLREAIAAYLATARGINCTSRQILITNGYQDALGLIARVLLKPGDAVWLEDPGYWLARAALEAAGAKTVPVRVDAEGLRVADGVAQARAARFAVVTPSHQSPLGVALTLPRRIALLAWAAEAGAWVIEDDYDSEFRYVGRPLPALKSLDRNERVLYAGSFSKTLFPALRLGYLVVPERLVAAFASANEARCRGLPAFTQAVIAAFMAEGHFARHLKRMRNLYGARRQALMDALAAVFGDRVTVDRQPGGMHLVVRPSNGRSDVELARRARAEGFAAEALSSRAIKHACGPALLLGFTNIAESDALETCRRLARVIGKQLGSQVSA
jgi:GntR family transcriptional regulator/MocR family aminotransferase